ncbi:hypothetical protein A9174_24955 [Mesorhizobium loti NZP2037]|nr:hypothetical protein [Mesorhizobium loti]ANN59644.1 hypothetical protein A9174_24955 [Mesorhizobium loti NZP2037]
MKDLANVDGWQSRLIVPSSFEQYTGAGKGSEDGKGGQRNGEPRALLRRFHSLNQFFETGFHQKMLNEDLATEG